MQPAVYVDADGKVVGPEINYSVQVRLDGYVIKLCVDYIRTTSNGVIDRSGAKWCSSEPVYFEQSECLGTPYVGLLGFNGEMISGYAYAGVVLAGAGANAFTLYVGDLRSGARLVPASLYQEGVCSVPSDPTYEMDLYPVVATYDLGAMFKLPLRVR